MDKLVTFSGRCRKKSSFHVSDFWLIICFMCEFLFTFDIVAGLLLCCLRLEKVKHIIELFSVFDVVSVA